MESDPNCPKCHGTGNIIIGGSFEGPVTIYNCDCHLLIRDKEENKEYVSPNDKD